MTDAVKHTGFNCSLCGWTPLGVQSWNQCWQLHELVLTTHRPVKTEVERPKEIVGQWSPQCLWWMPFFFFFLCRLRRKVTGKTKIISSSIRWWNIRPLEGQKVIDVRKIRAGYSSPRQFVKWKTEITYIMFISTVSNGDPILVGINISRSTVRSNQSRRYTVSPCEQCPW